MDKRKGKQETGRQEEVWRTGGQNIPDLFIYLYEIEIPCVI